MLKPKVGDFVRLKPCEVTRVVGGTEIYLGGRSTFVYETEIEEILPRPLEVGDRVRTDSTGTYARVIAIHNNFAWLEWTTGQMTTLTLGELRRIDDAP